MKSSALLRFLILLGLSALFPAGAVHAGSLNSVFGSELNDLTTPNDDMLIELPLQFYAGGRIQFYYQTNMDGRSVLSGDVLDGFGNRVLRDPEDVLPAVQRAFHRWNTAAYVGTRKFSLYESFTDTKTIVPQPLPDGINTYIPSALAVDGFCFIDFQATQNVAAGGPAMTVISYFSRDFPLSKMVSGAIPNPQISVNVVTNQGGGAAGGGQAYAFANWNYVGQLGAGGAGQAPVPMRLFIPLQDFKQGNVFDIDIAINDSQLQYFRAWPSSLSQVPLNQRDEVERNLDLEMIFMHEMGWAMGLGNSMIFDSVMYPYYNTRAAGNDPPFVTNQFRKRLLAFDDEMTAALAWGATFPNTLGTISGQILDGATIGAITPLTPGQQQTGTVPGPQTTNPATTVDPFLAQVPVFLGVKTTELAKMPPTLTSGRADLAALHADNILSNSPFDPADVNRGDWRMMAHVLSGQKLAIPASQGPAQTGGTGGGPGGGEPGGGGTGGGTTVPGPDLGTITQVSRNNGLYTFPGVPPMDTTGLPINYAVYLPSQIRTGTANSFFCNIFRSQFIPTQTAARYTFPNEFYGGLNVPLTFGSGIAPIVINTTDDQFMSNYIIGEMDFDGRIAAAINQGPTLLSGYNMGPLSFIVLTMADKFYTNQLGQIARNTVPVVVTDAPAIPNQVQTAPPNTAIGTWEELNKFRIKVEMSLSSAGGLVGIPAALQVTYTIVNISSASASLSLRQVLDTNVFGRENPVYLVNGQIVNNSTTYQGAQIPRQILFQSWATSSTAVRGWLEPFGGANTTPDWITIGTLGELNKILSGPGLNLRDPFSQSLDSGIALGWKFDLASNQRKIITYTFGYFPGGQVMDSWFPYPATTPVGTVLSGFEDDPHKIQPVTVAPGKTTDGIDIYTNTFTGTSPAATNQPTVEGSATGLLQFIRLASGFPDYNTFFTMGGALGDLDNDGDLDAVTCAINGNNPGAGSMNRIYLNEVRLNTDGSTARYFRDVTLGDNVSDPNGFRLLPLHDGENTYSVVLADFDDDGWLEIFFTKRGAQNRYYDNLGPDKPGFFIEDTEAVPGLLNGPPDTALDVPFRAAAGDIDSDGDIDIIVSQFFPFVTTASGWIDTDNPPDQRMSHSRDHWTDYLKYAERVLINYKYTPSWAAKFNLELRQERTDQLGTYFLDETLGTDDSPGTLTSLHTERFDNIAQYQYVVSWDPSELDRMPPLLPNVFSYPDAPPYTPTDRQDSIMGYHAVEPRLGPLFGGSALDLMSVRTSEFPLTTVWSGSNPTPLTDPWTPSPPGPPYITVGSANLSFPSPAPYVGTDSAFFRNLDLFNSRNSLISPPPGPPGITPLEVTGDGVPDGYFACMNYNMDYGVNGQEIITASQPREISTPFGLFVFEQDNATSSNRSLFRYDAFPLFTGFPDAYTPVDTPKAPWMIAADQDIVPNAGGRSAYAGVIGDWENRSRPLPMILSDINNAAANEPYVYTVTDGLLNFSGDGFCRGSSAAGTAQAYIYSGDGTQYFDAAIFPYSVVTTQQTYVPWVFKVFPTPTGQTGNLQDGQPYGAAAGDFDCDGDEDVFFVNSSDLGFSRVGNTYKAPKQVFTNDSFANFSEAVNALSPNEPAHGMYCAAGDLDNDGDLDLVSFNMLGPNEAYINQAFTRPPNPLDDTDPTMFFDATYKCIPNIGWTVFGGPQQTARPFTGANVASSVADLNLDGRPDLLLADGGQFTQAGDYARVLLNGGKPVGDAVPIFKPAGAAYPPPRTDLWVHNLVNPDGYFFLFNSVKHWQTFQRPSEQFNAAFYLGYCGGPLPSFVNDLQAGDVDNDGDPDLLIVRAGGGTGMSDGPQLLFNMDSDEPVLNSFPDTDSKGDAIFTDANLIRLTDPGTPALPGGQMFKNQGQRARFADFDGDRFADIVIANGFPSDQSGRGAPNVILMNNRPVPGRFADETETRLPTVTEAGITHGIYDNTVLLAVGDFDSDGDVDIIFGNQSTPSAPLGFRLMLNDGTGHFTDVPQGQKIPTFGGRKPKGLAVADIDGLGEPTEDKNHNGLLDPGEDSNGNGTLDWTDLPTETEDLNGNGALDSGEDGLIGAANGKLDFKDLNNDGIFTARHPGIWDGSLDVVVTFDNDIPAILINDPTGRFGATFRDEAATRLWNLEPNPNRGVDIGDINLDGYPDIVIAQYVGGITFPVKLWLNQPQITGGKVRWGFFKDVTHEVPYPRGESVNFEVSQNIIGPNDTSVSGWYTDAKLLDADGDGDLDLFVAGGSTTKRPIAYGTMDLMYLNRVVGDSFNMKGYDVQKNKVNPSVLSIWPRGATRGAQLDVRVAGENFQAGTLLSFGPGVNIRRIQKVDTAKLTVSIDVDTTATLGPRAVLAQNPSGSPVASKVGLFNVFQNLPNEVDDRTWSLYN